MRILRKHGEGKGQMRRVMRWGDELSRKIWRGKFWEGALTEQDGK